MSLLDTFSDRANEVAQNTHKNPHLVALGLGEGTDGGTTGGDTSEATNPGQCDTINAGCTAGEVEDALYTGDEIVIIGDTKEQQFYYHPDHLGSTAYITDSSGQLTEHLEYFPFGETWVQEGGSKKTPYLYTGKELDQETGLYYYGARYYDPRVSVWASPDPILEKYLPTGDPEKDKNLAGMGGVFNTGNIGLYTYTHNNPVIYTDPDGNEVILKTRRLDLILIGGAGVHSFLDIRPDNPDDFGGKERWTIGGYEGGGKLVTEINKPVDFNWSDDDLKSSSVLSPPEGMSDSEFISKIMEGFEGYEPGSRDYEAFPAVSRNEGNCNNITSGALSRSGFDVGILKAMDPPGANPGLGVPLPEMSGKPETYIQHDINLAP